MPFDSKYKEQTTYKKNIGIRLAGGTFFILTVLHLVKSFFFKVVKSLEVCSPVDSTPQT